MLIYFLYVIFKFFSLETASSDESDVEESMQPGKVQHDFTVSDDVSRLICIAGYY